MAFYRCEALVDVDLPDSLKAMGDRAFDYCKNLKSVTFGNNLEAISDSAFASCYNIESLIIPGNIKHIGYASFSNCQKLSKLHFCNGVEVIDENAFWNCKLLTSVVVPDSVKEIGSHAFSGCPKLTSLNLGYGVETIGNGAFDDSRIVPLIIPASVKKIDLDAFRRCYPDIYYYGTEDDWNKIEMYVDTLGNRDVKTPDKFNYLPKDSNIVSVDDLSLNYKSTAILNPTVSIPQNCKWEMTYYSTNPSVAKVDNNGKVTATGTGTATIICKVIDENGNVETSCSTVTVKYSIIQWIINILLLGFLWY